MLHITTPHSKSLRIIRLLRSALPTAVFMVVLNGVVESVMAQTPPNYVCYLRTPSGEVVNLSAICGTGNEADTNRTVGNSLTIRDVQVTDAGVTGVIVNESNQPVRIDGLGYELTQANGQAVLTGSATPATNVLLPNEPVQFSASFSGDDRTQLSEYANVDLELAIAPNSVTPVEQDRNTVSGEVENFPTINTNTGEVLNNGGLSSETGVDGINDAEAGNNPNTDNLGGVDDADEPDPTDSTFDSDGNTDVDDTFDSTGSINDGSDGSDGTSDVGDDSDPTDNTFDADGNTDTNDTFDSTGNTETLNNGGDSDSNTNR